MSQSFTGGVWAEIDLDNIAHNTRVVKDRINKNTILMGVVKANGYGHGAVSIAQTLIENGVERFAVATLSEAIELRLAGITIPILILSYTPQSRLTDVARHDITQTVYRYDQAKALSDAALRMDKKIKIHLKIETGMNRLGFLTNEASIRVIKEINELPNIEIEGVYTHFALSYVKDKSYTHKQVKCFVDFCVALEEQGVRIPIKHVSNSATVTDLSEYNMDMVRVGSSLYGLPHKEDLDSSIIDLRPAMTLKTKISNYKTLVAGVGISYGLKYITKDKCTVASIPVGYVDGLTRIGSGKFNVLVHGKKVPQIGTICMDQCMIDVTGIEEIAYEDEVILLGTDGINCITADENARILETSNCEIVCSIGRRVPRVYIKNKKIEFIVDELLDKYKEEA